MKKISTLLFFIVFAISNLLAQTPNQLKYQAVLRDASGQILAGETVTVDISILQSDLSTSVFDESHIDIITTAQGLINLNIGSVSDLSVVDWSADTYFIEISVNSVIMGTSQLLSAERLHRPYVLAVKYFCILPSNCHDLEAAQQRHGCRRHTRHGTGTRAITTVFDEISQHAQCAIDQIRW